MNIYCSYKNEQSGNYLFEKDPPPPHTHTHNSQCKLYISVQYVIILLWLLSEQEIEYFKVPTETWKMKIDMENEKLTTAGHEILLIDIIGHDSALNFVRSIHSFPKIKKFCICLGCLHFLNISIK